MKGIVIWAHSTCRSTILFFQGIACAFDAVLEIYILRKESDLRKKTGFSDDEFKHLNIQYIDNYDIALSVLKERLEWHHIFGCYQERGNYQRLMLDAHRLGCHIGIASEAPCNMDDYPRRIFKSMYINCILPFKLRQYINLSDFIINFSGSENWRMEQIGWNPRQIIPCGYYSPAIPNSHLVKRTEKHWQNFNILLTGIHQTHRSPMVLLKALHLLDGRGIKYECQITQEGPLLEDMKQYVKTKDMNHVHFRGFIPLDELISLYENCSIFVGAGNNEPWGIRLNDALQCGAPLVVNRGMGGFKLVDDYGCGLTFARNDYKGLADALERLITDKQLYLQCAENAYEAAFQTCPENKAKEIVSYIKSHFDKWN